MSNLILTILFGYLGTYSFSKKQNKLGFVYLFTCGLFGIGWIYDIYLAYLDYKKSQKHFTDSTHQKQSQENFIEKNNTDTHIVSQTEETSHNIENGSKTVKKDEFCKNGNEVDLDDALETIKTYNENLKNIIYDKTILLTHTNTEGRQRIIKKLVNDNSIEKSNDGILLGCNRDIEDGEMISGKKCINVVVINARGYKDIVGYIPDNLIEELHTTVAESYGYSVDLYANQDDDLYTLKARIKFYSDPKKNATRTNVSNFIK